MAGSAAAMRGAQRVEQVARLSQLVQRHFPPVAFAFAYGSGVMHQPGLYTSGSSGDGQPMVDMIFAVEGAREWHKQVRRCRMHAAPADLQTSVRHAAGTW
mmetsp:Transcript_31179/g.92999  ORF Transcript_31179/g.92999 Transcript_31179/m.92999 type:complete len:100 (+) Transcript_31179:257-556(+)